MREREVNRVVARFLSTWHYWVSSHRQDLNIFTHVQLYSDEVEVSTMFEDEDLPEIFVEVVAVL